MTEGHGTCGQPTGSRKRPQGGRITPILLLFAPFGDGRRELLAIRRFHSLRSFHQRLFTFAPFGDGRHELPAFLDSSGTADMSFRHFPILRGRSHLPLAKLEFMIFSSSLFAFQKICKALRDLTEIIWWFRIIDVYLQGRRMNYIKLKNTNNLTK